MEAARRIGRARSTTPRTGRFNARGRGAKLASSFPREHGWSLTEGGMHFRARRVVVKARVMKLRGTGSKAALAHLRYLQRDGATLDGERGRLYSSFQDDADGPEVLLENRLFRRGDGIRFGRPGRSEHVNQRGSGTRNQRPIETHTSG